MSVKTLTLTEFQVLETVPVVPTLGTTLALGGFSSHCFSLPCRHSLMGKKTSLALPSCHPCVLCFVATLACPVGEKLTLQTKFLSKYM